MTVLGLSRPQRQRRHQALQLTLHIPSRLHADAHDTNTPHGGRQAPRSKSSPRQSKLRTAPDGSLGVREAAVASDGWGAPERLF